MQFYFYFFPQVNFKTSTTLKGSLRSFQRKFTGLGFVTLFFEKVTAVLVERGSGGLAPHAVAGNFLKLCRKIVQIKGGGECQLKKAPCIKLAKTSIAFEKLNLIKTGKVYLAHLRK